MVSVSHQAAPFKGIAFMVLSVFFMNLNNALLKWLSAGYSPEQIIFMRSVIMMVIAAAMAHWSGGLGILRPNNLLAHGSRGFLQLLNGIFFVLAVTYLPLAETVALTFAAPLFLTALAIPFLGETVGWRRWGAVIVGFIGIIIITRPTGGALQFAMIFPLAAAFTGAVRDIVTRKLTARENSLSILFSSALIATVGTAPFLPGNWATPDWIDLGLVLATGLCVAAGHFLMIDMFRYVEASTVAPFRYTAIIWATILGYIIWDHLPDAYTVLGVAIVVASGLYILRRQQLVARGVASD
jgi:drug/metabolite transporter (DMT)-like permease